MTISVIRQILAKPNNHKTATLVRNTLITSVAACFMFVVPQTSMAEADGQTSLDQQLKEIAEEYSLPALGAVRVTGNGEVELASVGKRGDGKPVSIQAAWHIGSIGKSMTSTVAVMLAKQGKLHLDVTPEDVWPDIVVHPSLVDTTLSDLLRHRSGITSKTRATTDWTARFTDTRPTTEQRSEWAESILANAPEQDRGKYLYSNAGYILAGAMLETLTGKSYEQLLKEYIFRPLKMLSAGFGAPRGEEAIWGHRKVFLLTQGIKPSWAADNPSALAPAGTMHLSLEDMSKYMKLHLGFYPKLLDQSDLALLHSPLQGERYALGLSVRHRKWGKGKVLRHSGSNTMWMANLWLAPNTKSGYFAVTNLGSKKAFQATDDVIGLLIKRH